MKQSLLTMPVSDTPHNEEPRPAVRCLFTPIAMHVMEDLTDDISNFLSNPPCSSEMNHQVVADDQSINQSGRPGDSSQRL